MNEARSLDLRVKVAFGVSLLEVFSVALPWMQVGGTFISGIQVAWILAPRAFLLAVFFVVPSVLGILSVVLLRRRDYGWLARLGLMIFLTHVALLAVFLLGGQKDAAVAWGWLVSFLAAGILLFVSREIVRAEAESANLHAP